MLVLKITKLSFNQVQNLLSFKNYANFCVFSLFHTDHLGGAGKRAYTVEPSWQDMIPPTYLSIWPTVR
jgi:hypothetical protein